MVGNPAATPTPLGRSLYEFAGRLYPICRSITGAGLRESHPHDVTITKEAPNYRR